MSERIGSVPPAGPVEYEIPRPTRAELRRAAEAAARVVPPHVTSSETLDRGQPRSPVELSRTEQRRLADAKARAARSQQAIWKAWWLYPLAVGIGVCVWFGVQSASNQPDTTPRVVTTITAQP